MNDLPLLRTSERSSFKTCEQQWDWAYNQRLKPRVEGHALRFGDLIHRALAEYYPEGLKRGPHPTETFVRLYESEYDLGQHMGFREPEGDWIDAKLLGMTMLDGYVEHYEDEDKKFKVIATEQSFQVPIKTKKGNTVGWYVGTVDGLFENRKTKRLIIRDYKTTAKYAQNDGPLALNDQAGAYWTFGVQWLVTSGIIRERAISDIEKMEYRFLKKAMPDRRRQDAEGYYLNLDGKRSQQQPTPLFWEVPVYRTEHNREVIRRRVVAEVRKMEAVRESIPVKNPGPLHMPNCLGCGYKDMCELHEAGADWKSFRDSEMVEWDPYEQHGDYQL